MGETMTETLGQAFEGKANNLNLMRLLAALAVIYGHASAISGKGPADIALVYLGYKFIGGIAVDVFFVISGFLITASALGSHGLRYFAASRALRIFPGLMVCVGASVFILGPLLTTAADYWQSPQTWSYLWRNALTYQTEYFLPGVFQENHDKAVNGSLWSLPVEVRLYLLIAVLALLRVLQHRAVFNVVFFSILLVGYFEPTGFTRVFEHENHRHVAMMFLMGAFFWINRDAVPLNPALLLVLLIFAASQHKTSGFGAAYVVTLVYLVFYLAFAPWGQWFNRFGDYSYGVYLYGWLSQQLVAAVIPNASNAQLSLWPSLLALLLAMVSWHLIEQPALRLRKRFKPATTC